MFTIWVDDADAVCAELAKRGVALLNGPYGPASGVYAPRRSLDPDGHAWEVAEQLGG